MSRRHIAVFAIVATPAIVRSLAGALCGTKLYQLLAPPLSHATATAGSPLLNRTLLVIGTLASLTWAGSKLARTETAIAKSYPVKAVDFLEQAGLVRSRGYNTYGWGGYLIWRRVPVFIDGRAEVYGNEFLSEYFKTYRLTDGWEQPLDKFDVTFVLMEKGHALATLLATTAAWQEVYADDVARVFRRVTTR